MADTRVVLITGARQAGKSTLARQIRRLTDAEWRNLDRAAHRQAAAQDPTGFVDTPAAMGIDEVQRVPELLLAIKERVDEDARPGQFLLTGSARVLAMRSSGVARSFVTCRLSVELTTLTGWFVAGFRRRWPARSPADEIATSRRTWRI